MSSPARWLVVRARLASGVVDDGRLADALIDLGGRAVQMEDEGWWVTHLAEAAVDTDRADLWRDRLSGYLPPGGIEVECSWQDHEDWAELWKRGLEPRRLTDRLVVTPSWCTPERGPGDVVITVDPGMAFGNAEHGTTRGCLRLLDEAVRPGDRVLDVGAGSGILAIAAALFGASEVWALEADPLAIPTAIMNAEANQVADRVTVVEETSTVASLRRRGRFDGVVANIQRAILEGLLPGLRATVRPGGWLILSGVPAEEWDAMAASARTVGFVPDAVDADGEWRSGRFRAPGP
ncbi:MAG: 50S ribosomal protein L11 methyltransferase [Gemmatimonadetes bacterium]|nr:50S ribosomal protein L11 methyltransferase [Gemmatimonadota bacterium]